jgi:ribosomal protein S18 acetylase RimI-like enzyme
MVTIRAYLAQDFPGVQAAWVEAFPDDHPENRAESSIAAKLKDSPDLLLVAVDDDHVVGTIMAGYDGHRGWLYSVAVRKSHRGSSIGSKLVEEAEARLRALGCHKINLQIRTDNHRVANFYRSLGYEIEDRISMGKLV